jgi:hypothetical protein
MDIEERASGILGRSADIVTPDGLHEELQARIEKSDVPALRSEGSSLSR